MKKTIKSSEQLEADIFSALQKLYFIGVPNDLIRISMPVNLLSYLTYRYPNINTNFEFKNSYYRGIKLIPGYEYKIVVFCIDEPVLHNLNQSTIVIEIEE